MKCELCQKADAEVAITREKDGEEQELYVCTACARAERARRQKKSQRTRKITGLPPGMQISIGGTMDEPPPFIGAIINAVQGVMSDMEKASNAKSGPQSDAEEPSYRAYPLRRIESVYRIGSRLHLEGLHLIGELEPVIRAARALDLRLEGVDADGVRGSGHVYALRYAGDTDTVRRFCADLVHQERNARLRLFEEMPRVFSDSLCRALAVLKNCRLLAPGEFFDLLSPLRLASLEGMLDGIGLDEIENLLGAQDLTGAEDKLSQDERDRLDAQRADSANERFEDVMMNERGEERFR